MKKQRSYKGEASGKLFLVPTPIGNLEDMTFRGIRMLKEADLIASEDTRNTQKLLNHFEVTTPQKSFHEHNYKERIPEFIALLEAGKQIAQVSDAGMPSISDPGHELVEACIEANIPVIALPGATAGMTALIASGLPPQPFVFIGFLPRKKIEQQTELTALVAEKATMIFYESPHRLQKTCQNIAEVLGKDRRIVVCRELTKLYEEYLRGTAEELADYLSETSIKGECCLLVEGAGEQVLILEDKSLKEQVDDKIALGMKPNQAIKEVAKQNQLKKQEVYKEFHGIE